MRTVLGIDQGGSKTHAILAEESGRILGLGTAPGACHSVTGMESAMAAVAAAVGMACAQAGAAPESVARVCAGLTGVDWPEEEPLLRGELSRRLEVPEDRVTVINDCLIALRAATDSGRACILCAGSGLNCGVRRDGETYVFGYFVADEDQGGGALGRRTVQAVIDGGCGLRPVTPLSEAVLSALGCGTAEELLRARVEQRLDGDRVLHLPELLERFALAGDAAACGLLETFGRDIARYPAAGLRHLGLAGEAVELVLSGSVFKCRAPQLRDTVVREVRAAAPLVRVTESEYEPIVGALLGALDGLGVAENASVREEIRRGAERFGLFRRTIDREG